MSKVIKIPPGTLKELSAGLIDDSVTRNYWDESPLVRSLYWRRFDVCLRLCKAAPDERVLDFGCGTGVFLPSLSARFSTVFGVDLKLDIARRLVKRFALANVTLLGGDARRLPFEDRFFGAVFAVSVLEHFREPTQPLAEIARVLKPGGELIVSSPTENVIYKAGRKVFGYVKPKDHYSTADDVREAVARLFHVEQVRGWPLRRSIGLSAFEVIRATAPVAAIAVEPPAEPAAIAAE
jgi:ubiquinone/menaquinone biosynthesis C-methylase UbiE